jgi:hypothetical protein
VEAFPLHPGTLSLITPEQEAASRFSPSLIRAVANTAMGRQDVLPFWFGESDQSTPPFIREAAIASLHAGETFYSENLGRPYLRQAISTYLTDLHQLPIGTDRIARAGGGLGIATEISGLEPADFRATRGEKTSIDSGRSYTNFELLYSGVAAGALRLTYREYSPNDLSRPASFQDLTYNLAEKSVRFKSMLLDIESADNQSIRFRVKSVPQEWMSAAQP